MTNQFSASLPPDISTHGAGIDRLLGTLHVFMLALFVGWAVYFIYCLVRFRERPGHVADTRNRRFAFPAYLELGILLFELFLLIFVSSPLWQELRAGKLMGDPQLIIRIQAEQFAWNVHYPGPDGKFGKTLLDKVEGTNPLGLDRSDPNTQDDIVSVNNLHVPVGTPVEILLSSKDVIHSFNIPVMRVKQDMIPGMTIPIRFEATRTGTYDIACAQLCGISHYRMKGRFIVENQEAFENWLKKEGESLSIAETN